jgi:hypothetical protein
MSQTIPEDWPVRPVPENTEGATRCGECGLSWQDWISTALTPTPAGRCPFEYFHEYEPATPAKSLTGTISVDFEASFDHQVEDVIQVIEIVAANIFQNALVRAEVKEN